MKSYSDVIGLAFKDRLKGHKAKYLFENHLREKSDDYAYYFKNQVTPFEKKLLKHVKGPVIDLTSGNGRMLDYLEKNGVSCAGIEKSKPLADYARKKGLAVIGDDLLTFKKYKNFNTALIFYSLGVTGDPKRLHAFLRALHKNSPKGFTLIIGDYPLSETDVKEGWFFETGEEWVKERIRVHYKRQKSAWFEWIYLKTDFVKKALRKNGWRINVFLSTPAVYGIAARKMK